MTVVSQQSRPMPGGAPDIAGDVIAGVWPIDRALWKKALYRNLRQPNSKLFRNLPNHGPKGAALIVAGGLWIGPAILVGMAGAAIHTFVPTHSSGQIGAYVLWTLTGLFIVITWAHAFAGWSAGKRYRLEVLAKDESYKGN
jgi:hypothetical protein